MNSYDVEFYTNTEATNSWRAAEHAWSELVNSQILLVTNTATGKTLEVRLLSGEILCAACGVDIGAGHKGKDCENCDLED